MNFGFEIGDKVQILKYSTLGFSYMNYGEYAEIIEFPNIPVGSINLVGFKHIKVKKTGLTTVIQKKLNS